MVFSNWYWFVFTNNCINFDWKFVDWSVKTVVFHARAECFLVSQGLKAKMKEKEWTFFMQPFILFGGGIFQTPCIGYFLSQDCERGGEAHVWEKLLQIAALFGPFIDIFRLD